MQPERCQEQERGRSNGRMRLFDRPSCHALLPSSGRLTAFYHPGSTVTLPSRSPEGYNLTDDAARSHLLIGRRHDGVTGFDVATHKVVAAIVDTEGANKTIVVFGLDRGFSLSGDGTSTESRLPALTTIRRIRQFLFVKGVTTRWPSSMLATASSLPHPVHRHVYLVTAESGVDPGAKGGPRGRPRSIRISILITLSQHLPTKKNPEPKLP